MTINFPQLKPCPFCGAEPDAYLDINKKHVTIECPECQRAIVHVGLVSKKFSDMPDHRYEPDFNETFDRISFAINSWNERI